MPTEDADRPEPDDQFDDRPYRPPRRYEEDGSEITQEHATWAMFAHLGQLFFGFLAPVVIWIAFGERSPYVVRHAKESLNFSISLVLHMLVVLVVGALGAFVGYVIQPGFWPAYIGFVAVSMPLSLAFVVWEVVYVIKASIAAYKYRDFRYPLTVRLIG